jgi:flagellar biosynthesis protein FlhF
MATKTFKANSIKEAIGQVKASLGAEAMILSTKRIPKGPQNPYGKDFFEITAAAQDDMTDLLQAGSEKVSEKPASWIGEPPIRGNRGDWQDIQSELSEIKDMLLISNHTSGIPRLLGLHPACLSLYSKLLASGISERRVWAIMQAGGAFERKQAADPEAVAKHVVKVLKGAIGVSDPFLKKDGVRCVAAFVGPTGVGKTTTIAKLSAELSLKQKRNVGIISVDSYRIGAVDQLKTYASIMGLPCLSAFTREDLAQALKKMEGRDVILIDTAGQSHRDMKRLKELGELLGKDLSIETHLVLSTAIKPEDMKEAATNFSILKPSSYVFSKVDETRTRGGVIDQLLDRKLPISYITNGQRVPEDIIFATQRRVLRLILQGAEVDTHQS